MPETVEVIQPAEEHGEAGTPQPAADNLVRAVVISDIHASIEVDPETIVAQATAAHPDQNPLVALRPFLRQHVSCADIVICPGDLVNRGEIGPIDWVWSELHQIASDLGAKLVGTAGNHDLLLKPVAADRAEKGLRNLAPRFPHDETTSVDTYWAHQLAIVREANWRVVAINSCSHYGGYDPDENNHGRLTAYCQSELPDRLDATDGAEINICVVHHHPQEWTVDSDRNTSHMSQGDRLIAVLESRPEPWMFVHGHQHYPRLDYIGHSSGGPVRLSSGSVGANLLGELGASVRNQVHLIEFDLDAPADLGLSLAGHIDSFDWSVGNGWGGAAQDGVLPPREGFGYRRDGFELASWLRGRALELGQLTWSWSEVVALEPRADFLADCDREEFYRAVDRLGGGVQASISEVTFP